MRTNFPPCLCADAVLDRASSVLRILFVRELRDLQTRVDEFVVAVQEFTADRVPIDSSLGRVGYWRWESEWKNIMHSIDGYHNTHMNIIYYCRQYYWFDSNRRSTDDDDGGLSSAYFSQCGWEASLSGERKTEGGIMSLRGGVRFSKKSSIEIKSSSFTFGTFCKNSTVDR